MAEEPLNLLANASEPAECSDGSLKSTFGPGYCFKHLSAGCDYYDAVKCLGNL
jgi:hypothetical protein